MKIDFRSLANPAIQSLHPYEPGKPIETLERELGIKSAIKLASNENPLGPSPLALQAAKQALEYAHIYPDGAYYDLKQALSAFLNVYPNQITVGNGSENILELIIKAYLHEPNNAIISQYAFLTIPILLKSYNIPIKVVPAFNWGHDINAMIAAIDEQTKILFLVNPNNPTGTHTTKKEFETLMERVSPHILVVVDEAYSEYIVDENYPITLNYLSQFPNLIICRTFSKIYGLAALRMGYCVSSPEIADILNRARLPFNVNSIAAKAAAAALTDHEHVTRSLELNQKGMQQMITGLQSLQLNFIPSMANFITIDVEDGQVVYQQLLYQGVIVRPLHAYQMPRHIRVTIGTETQNKKFLESL